MTQTQQDQSSSKSTAVLETPARVTSPETQAQPKRAKPRRRPAPKVRWWEAKLSQLSARSNFFHRLCSLIWLPYAFRSGIRMKQVDASTFTAVLPFKRFNKNWYNAMAGAALLANAEVAAGMYLFGRMGQGYSIVCKELNYQFRRPCFGPAIFRVTPISDIDAQEAAGGDFTAELQLIILQQINPPLARNKKADPTASKKKDRRVGNCTVKFYVTPKSLRSANKGKDRK